MACKERVRRGEEAALRWSDVDFERRVLHVRRAFARVKGKDNDSHDTVVAKCPKNGEERDVPLNDVAVAALKAHRARQAEDVLRYGEGYDRASDLVFCDSLGRPWHLAAISNAFRRCAKDAGVRVRLHDLRHTTASWLINAGIDIRTVSAVVGHKHTSTTLEVYAHLMPNATARAVDVIAKRLSDAG